MVLDKALNMSNTPKQVLQLTYLLLIRMSKYLFVLQLIRIFKSFVDFSVRRDGDLYAAIPDNQIGKCRYIMCGTFETGRKGLDASLEAGLEAHRDLIASKYPNGGVGSDPFITIGKRYDKFCIFTCGEADRSSRGRFIFFFLS